MANQDEYCTNDGKKSKNVQSKVSSKSFKTLDFNRGVQRWKMLSNVVKNKKYNSECQNPGTKRLKIKPINTNSVSQIYTPLYNMLYFKDDPFHKEWVQAFWNRELFPNESLNLKLKMIPKQFSLNEIAGFDNSGNVRLWPCEELLAYLCSFGIIRDYLKNTVFCELGAGMTALAGLVSAKMNMARKIILTDGNERSVENIQEIVKENFSDSDESFSYSEIDVRRIRWEDSQDYHDLCHSVETIICADCLFVPKYHQHLLNTLDNLLVLSTPYSVEKFHDHISGEIYLYNSPNHNHHSTNAISCSNSDTSSGICDSSSSPNDSRSNISELSSNLISDSNCSSVSSAFSSSSFSSATSSSSSPNHTELVARVFIVAPQRDSTLESFIRLVRSDGRFQCLVLDHFDQSFFTRLTDINASSEDCIENDNFFGDDNSLYVNGLSMNFEHHTEEQHRPFLLILRRT